MPNTILKINASARHADSASRPLVDRTTAQLSNADTTVIDRDLSQAVPQLDEAWLGANWTPETDRSADQTAALALSEELIAELEAADTIVIGAPMYNFGIPASLKAWIDLICRNGRTFEYTENGPKGLLEGKRAIVIAATGGVPLDAPTDHMTPYMRTVLSFIGVQDITIIDAATLVANSDTVIPQAHAAIDAIAA